MNPIFVGSYESPPIELIESPIEPTEKRKGMPIPIANMPFNVGKIDVETLGCLYMGTRGRPIRHILTGPQPSEVDSNGRPFVGTVAVPFPNTTDYYVKGMGADLERPEIMNPSNVPHALHLNSFRLTRPNIAEVPNLVK
jgi:hypothetical protein